MNKNLILQLLVVSAFAGTQIQALSRNGMLKQMQNDLIYKISSQFNLQ